ncbi:hypothetical protein EVAR_10724_1 [Eumeta japonica]|uniref:Uncharacterized protein n=1 Tax=Eumeta variegata TaxID=151549 RepID=A0A4C1U8G5_EUMVA|nr:hypothetical protein EVAR_10724_1 [Eumeta japonica]
MATLDTLWSDRQKWQPLCRLLRYPRETDDAFETCLGHDKDRRRRRKRSVAKVPGTNSADCDRLIDRRASKSSRTTRFVLRRAR